MFSRNIFARSNLNRDDSTASETRMAKPDPRQLLKMTSRMLRNQQTEPADRNDAVYRSMIREMDKVIF